MEIVKNWKVHAFALVIVAFCEFLGVFRYKLIVLFPMLYAMLLGSIVSWPKFKLLDEKQMQHASKVLSVLMVLLLAKLGVGIGPQLPALANAKAALLLQEIGHFVGTILIGMPVAVALGLGRESIGATYSIDREPNIAIISEKYGLDSPEGRGVMAMYICGTIFGALWIAILAGAVAQMDIFHPYALAMGAGVGSGSMMAAAMGAVSSVYPEMKAQIQAYAGAANLMTTALGVWIALYFSLPVAIKYHALLTRLFGKHKAE